MSFDDVTIFLQQILLTLIDFENNENDLLNKKAINQKKINNVYSNLIKLQNLFCLISIEDC